MRVIRSWPDPLPEGRNYVVDDAERFYNTAYSYRGLARYGDDLIHLDWDQAVSREDLIRFAKHARQEPERVLVAPCRLREAEGQRERWNVYTLQPSGQATRMCTETDTECSAFGFGMVYLPTAALAEFESTWAEGLDSGNVRFTDTAFAGWYFRRFGPARLDWDVTCVHLHYRISEVTL